MTPSNVFVPNLSQTLKAGLPSLVFTRWRTQDTVGKKTRDKQVLKRRFYFSPFTRYSATYNQGSQGFIQTFSLRPYVLGQIFSFFIFVFSLTCYRVFFSVPSGISLVTLLCYLLYVNFVIVNYLALIYCQFFTELLVSNHSSK